MSAETVSRERRASNSSNCGSLDRPNMIVQNLNNMSNDQFSLISAQQLPNNFQFPMSPAGSYVMDAENIAPPGRDSNHEIYRRHLEQQKNSKFEIRPEIQRQAALMEERLSVQEVGRLSRASANSNNNNNEETGQNLTCQDLEALKRQAWLSPSVQKAGLERTFDGDLGGSDSENEMGLGAPGKAYSMLSCPSEIAPVLPSQLEPESCKMEEIREESSCREEIPEPKTRTSLQDAQRVTVALEDQAKPDLKLQKQDLVVLSPVPSVAAENLTKNEIKNLEQVPESGSERDSIRKFKSFSKDDKEIQEIIALVNKPPIKSKPVLPETDKNSPGEKPKLKKKHSKSKKDKEGSEKKHRSKKSHRSKHNESKNSSQVETEGSNVEKPLRRKESREERKLRKHWMISPKF